MMQLSLPQTIVVWSLPVLFAITLHEVAHGWVASKFGDQTARLSGRLTLNPLKHIDPVGTVIVPLILLTLGGFIFGWAKPVPVDVRNLGSPKRDMAIVALAGPLSNFLMAFFWAAIAKLGMYLSAGDTAGAQLLFYMGQAGIMINVMLALLNCLPIPPLDGGRVLCGILPNRWSWQVMRIEPVGFLILLLLMFLGVLSAILSPPITFCIRWVSALFGLF